MKNLIITFQNELNYGAILQAYALQHFMSEFSDTDVCNLAFRLSREKYINRIFSFSKEAKFKRFQKRFLRLSEKVRDVKDLENIAKNYTKIVVGSDQVFAFDLLNGHEDIFFLDFPCPKKYSYAASFGSNDNITNNISKLKKYLGAFSDVSVREPSSAMALAKNGIKSRCCVDPTLLLKTDDYVKEFGLKKKDTPYILVYAPLMDDEVINATLKLKKETEMNVVCFNVRNRFGRGTKCIPNASPKDFLEYFYNASFVVTNSFHGTCFSTIFRKPFVVVLSKKKEIRQRELLDEFKLSDRVYSADDGIEKYLKEPNFDDINNSALIRDSKEYLVSLAKEKI